MDDLDEVVRQQVRAAVARGDLDGALGLLGSPVPVRRSLFALDEDDGPLVVDVDPAELAAMVDVRLNWMRAQLAGAITAHVVSTLNRLRGRVD